MIEQFRAGTKELRDFIYKAVQIIGIHPPYSEEYEINDERKDKITVYDIRMRYLQEHIKAKQKKAEFHRKLRDEHTPNDLQYWNEVDLILTLEREELTLKIEYFSDKYFKGQAEDKKKYWEEYGKLLTEITNKNIETFAIKLEEKLGIIKNQKQKVLIIKLLKIYYDERPREQQALNDLYLQMQDAIQTIQ